MCPVVAAAFRLRPWRDPEFKPPAMAKLKAERAKDLLEPREYLKLLRADVRNLHASDFADKKNEDFVCSYTELFLDIAKNTPRVKASTLKTAVMLCYDNVTAETAKNFADKVTQAYQYVINKSKSYVTGARLSTPTKSVVQEYLRIPAQQNQVGGSPATQSQRQATSCEG